MNLAKLGILMALNVYMFKFCRSGFKFVKVSARVYVADQKCGCTSRVRTPFGRAYVLNFIEPYL